MEFYLLLFVSYVLASVNCLIEIENMYLAYHMKMCFESFKNIFLLTL